MKVSQDYNRNQTMLNVASVLGNTGQANNYNIALFSNNMPSDAALLSLINNTNGTTVWNSGVLSSIAVKADMLAVAPLAAFAPILDINEMSYLIPLSGQANLLTPVLSGVPKWFMLRQSSTATASISYEDFTAAGNSQMIIVGSVGDENSNADMKILGGSVAVGSPIRVPDIRLKF